MIYLHEKQINEKLIRHWANESETDEKATFKIKQVETGVIYDDAVDVIPCRYSYEVTNIPIEEETKEND